LAGRVKPRVAWLSFAALRKTPAGWTSDVASSRYRLTIPARALAELGCDSVVIDAAGLRDPLRLVRQVGEADVVIFGKLVASVEEFGVLGPRVLQFAAALAQRGARIVADFSDDVFHEAARRPYFRGIANICDAVVASTQALAQVLAEETASPVRVVTDPVEGPRGQPMTTPGVPLKVLWYGHSTNIDTLDIGVPQIARIAHRIPLAITLITSPASEVEERIRAIHRLPQCACRLVPWTTHAVFDALKGCDAVFIPSNPVERRRAIKSPNRFTEALWAGRFVVAHPLPAYEALADYGCVVEDLGAGLEWLVDNADTARDNIRAGQDMIEKRYLPSVVARQWRAAILAEDPSAEH
jgi:glycosyltransferase involved in cell wall biosynthesis